MCSGWSLNQCIVSEKVFSLLPLLYFGSTSTLVIFTQTYKSLNVQYSKCGVLSGQLSYVCHVLYASPEGWWPNVHLFNICHFEISQLAKSESLLREANLAWGCKSSQLHAEDRMSFLIMEMDREKISNLYRYGERCVWLKVCPPCRFPSPLNVEMQKGSQNI